MNDAAELVRNAREEAGLSLRSLAEHAGVSFTTICRIEKGHADPTLGTVRKLLDALGERLEIRRDVPPSPPAIADLVGYLSTDHIGQEQPDWTQLRSVLDALTRHPKRAPAIIRRRPEASGSAFYDNLLAGISEKVADDAGMARPPWTREIVPLREPWFAPGTPKMQAATAAAAPPQLAARGIYVPAATLWRDSG